MTDIVGNATINDAWETAVRLSPDSTFLAFYGTEGLRLEYTYAEFDKLISQVATAFIALGIGVGTQVIIQLPNCPQFLLALFGLTRIGAVAVPLNLQSSCTEVQAVLQSSDVEWAVIDECCLEFYSKWAFAESVPAAELRVLKVQRESYVTELRHRQSTAEASTSPRILPYNPIEDAMRERAQLNADSLAEILYTSGTTGTPKGVMITHGNLVFSGHYGIWQTSLRSDDRLYTTMPACHSNFQLAALMPVLMARACLILSPKYSKRRFWDEVRESKATVIQLISMMARTLLLQPESEKDACNNVRAALYFMPLSDAEKELFEKRFNVTLLNSYGSTESIGWAVTDPPNGERRWPSLGRAGLGYEVGIFGEDGHELPAGEVGEFRIKGTIGRSLMLGYYRNPEATAEVFVADVASPVAAEPAGSVDTRAADTHHLMVVSPAKKADTKVAGFPSPVAAEPARSADTEARQHLVATPEKAPSQVTQLAPHQSPTLGATAWLRTHDFGIKDADGWFYFVGRTQNMIKRSGESISAVEIENVLSAHPAIAEVAVIGVPDEVRDEAIKAYVSLVPDAQLTNEQILAYCRQELASYKVPQYLEFVDSFPRTASMKIDKKILASLTTETRSKRAS